MTGQTSTPTSNAATLVVITEAAIPPRRNVDIGCIRTLTLLLLCICAYRVPKNPCPDAMGDSAVYTFLLFDQLEWGPA